MAIPSLSLCADSGIFSCLWWRAASDGRQIDVLDVEDFCRLSTNTPAEFSILDQRHAVRWNDLLPLRQPRACRQLPGETLITHATPHASSRPAADPPPTH